MNCPGNAYFEPSAQEDARLESQEDECTCWLMQNQPGFTLNELCAPCKREFEALLDEEHEAEIFAELLAAPITLSPLDVAQLEDERKVA